MQMISTEDGMLNWSLVEMEREGCQGSWLRPSSLDLAQVVEEGRSVDHEVQL